MFSGIVEICGTVNSVNIRGYDRSMIIQADETLRGLSAGDSVAVNGVCLTVSNILEDGQWETDVSAETLACTTFSNIRQGDRVNLERALLLGERLNGHLVSGHIDAAGKIIDIKQDGQSTRVTIQLPAELRRYVAKKGSICIDGVSLTVNTLLPDGFDVNILPYTLRHTLFSQYQPGDLVNMEVDLIAKYIETLRRPQPMS